MLTALRFIVATLALTSMLAHGQQPTGNPTAATNATQNQAAPEGQVNAADLIKNAQRAVGQVVRAAQKDPSLARSNAKAKAFWDGLKDLNENLDKDEMPAVTL